MLKDVHEILTPVPDRFSNLSVVRSCLGRRRAFDADKGKELRIYLDGKLSASTPRTDGKIGGVEDYPLALGMYVASRSQWYAGRMDEVRLYRRALSAAEIAEEFKKQSVKVLEK